MYIIFIVEIHLKKNNLIMKNNRVIFNSLLQFNNLDKKIYRKIKLHILNKIYDIQLIFILF